MGLAPGYPAGADDARATVIAETSVCPAVGAAPLR
jgi:hypothetical protein